MLLHLTINMELFKNGSSKLIVIVLFILHYMHYYFLNGRGFVSHVVHWYWFTYKKANKPKSLLWDTELISI